MLSFNRLACIFVKQPTARTTTTTTTVNNNNNNNNSTTTRITSDERQHLIGYEHDSTSFLLSTTGRSQNLIELVKLQYSFINHDESQNDDSFVTVNTRTFKHYQSRILCQMDPSLHCVSASINSSTAHIVALTTLRYTSSANSATTCHASSGLYESFLIQLSDYTNHFDQKQPILFKRSPHFQRIQFVSENSFLLFQLNDNETRGYRIDLYKFQLNRKTGQMITSPILHATLCDNCIWFQWDADLSYLYYLAAGKKNHSSESGSTFLSCWKVSESIKVEPVYKYSVPIKESEHHYNHDKTPRRKRMSLSGDAHIHDLYQRTLMRACCPGIDYYLVSLDDNVDCLCKQDIIEASSSNRTYIMVKIFVLSHQQTITFAIPMGKNDSQKRAFFWRMRNVLVVYVPEVFLKLITITKTSQPSNLVTLSANHDVPQAISNLGSVLRGCSADECSLIPLFSKHKGESFVLNVSSGEILNFKLNCDALLDLMRDNYTRSNKIERALPMLQWSIVHQSKPLKLLDGSQMMDFTFADKMIESLYSFHDTCSRHRLENTYLFKEFILGTTYSIASNIYKMDSEFLMLVPSSIFSPHPLHKKDTYVMNVLAENRRSALWNQDDNGLPAMFLPNSELLLKNPYTTENSNEEQLTQQKPLSKSLWNIFSSRAEEPSIPSPKDNIAFEQQLKKSQIVIEQDHIALAWRCIFCMSLKNCITNAKVGKAWLAKKWATGYTFIICAQTCKLFQMIQTLCYKAVQSIDIDSDMHGHASMGERKWYFQLLELLERTMEEIGIPPPPGFHFQFSLIAYHVLSPRTFLQYAKRKSFLITKQFLDHIHDNGLCKDATFYNNLLQFMARSSSSTILDDIQMKADIKYLESDPREKDTLIAYYHSLAFQDKITASLSNSGTEKETKTKIGRSLESQLMERIFDEDDTVSWDAHLAYTDPDTVSDTESTVQEDSFTPLISFLSTFSQERLSSKYHNNVNTSSPKTSSSPRMFIPRSKNVLSPTTSLSNNGSNSATFEFTEQRRSFVQTYSSSLLRKHTPLLT